MSPSSSNYCGLWRAEFVEFNSKEFEGDVLKLECGNVCTTSKIKSGSSPLLVEITFFPSFFFLIFLFLHSSFSSHFPLFSIMNPFPPSYPPILIVFSPHFLFSTFHYSVLRNDGVLKNFYLFLFSSFCCDHTGSIISFLLCLMVTVDQIPNSATDVQFLG